MNPYFWFFAVWAFLITPVTVHAGVRFQGGFYWRIRILLAGIPIAEKRKGEKHQDAHRLLKAWRSPRRRLAAALIRDGSIRKVMRAFQCEQLQIRVRISFEDAAATAMMYAFCRTVLETLDRCERLPPRISAMMEVDFQSLGTVAVAQGIFSARLGTLAIAGIHLLISALRHRAALALEEQQYAASH